MAVLIEAQTGAEAYVQLGRQIVKTGRKVRPRGQPCYEIEDCTVVIENTEQAVPAGVGRAIRPGIGAAEYCQLLAGISWLEQLDMASGGRFSQFADDGRLHGAYGPRIYSQLQDAAATLEADPDSRQATLVIGRGLTRDGGAHDVPCTTCVQYRLRDGRLNATVTMRSSDWFLGIPYDWWMQSRLQLTLAWALGAQPGMLTWQAGSQHVYERDEDMTWKVAVSNPPYPEQPPAITLFAGTPDLNSARLRVIGTQEYARGICLGGNVTQRVIGTDYYRHLLPVPGGDWVTCEWCRYVVPVASYDIGTRTCLPGCVGDDYWRHG